MKKFAAKPMRPNQLIKALAAAKGYASKLSTSEMNRFIWTATSALKAAINSKNLVRAKDGLLRAAGK